jgi:cytochrome c553
VRAEIARTARADDAVARRLHFRPTMSNHPAAPKRSLATLVVLVGLVVGLARLSGATPKGPLLHLLPPENVAASTRAELRARMDRHGNAMSTLVKAVVLIDRPTITTMAQRIADEELLARADSQSFDRWRPLLPKAFFVEQETLRSTARSLAQAAAQGEPDAVLAERFGTLTATCVRCHGSYIHDLPSNTAGR